MGHDKLRKFAENEIFSCLLQPSAADVLKDGYAHLSDHPVKGHWVEQMFGGHEGEIVLELGCGKGEYTLELARRNPDRNYIGVDIKGARLWRGAKTATEEGLRNVAFLRTRIEFIGAFFAPGEVSDIWLTFSDPQMKGENKRLSSPVFLERYRRMLAPGGTVHLKTDSRFLHEYTMAVVAKNGLELLNRTTDLYSGGQEGAVPVPDEVREVQTFYESMFLEMGIPITYMSFRLDHDGAYLSPSDPEEFDSAAWREKEGPRRSFSHQPGKK